MTVSSARKQETLDDIVAAAAGLFRRKGYKGTGIDQVMAAARLTRGAFYCYFKSKAALFAAVIERRHGLTGLLQKRDGKSAETLLAQGHQVIDDYMNPAHLERVVEGCTMASLSVDVAQAGPKAQEAYARSVKEAVAELGRGLASTGEHTEIVGHDPRACASLATCVGALIMARACGDQDLAAHLLRASRDLAKAQLAEMANVRDLRK